MPGLYNWYLGPYQSIVMAHGTVYGHPKAKLPDGIHIHTSAVQEMAVEEGGLILATHSGTRYVLKPEGIHPRCGEDAASHPEMGRDVKAETASCLALFGIGAGFMEDCLRARREADARLMEEEGRLLEPGELTAIPAAEHDDEGLFSPDAVNGKGLYQTMLSENGEETDDP